MFATVDPCSVQLCLVRPSEGPNRRTIEYGSLQGGVLHPSCENGISERFGNACTALLSRILKIHSVIITESLAVQTLRP